MFPWLERLAQSVVLTFVAVKCLEQGKYLWDQTTSPDGNLTEDGKQWFRSGSLGLLGLGAYCVW